MTLTPWGDAARLRARKLPPGPATRRDLVARNQRERLFAATVASVAERGYAETRVADLVEISGVSRSAFYQYFHDKRDCFLATVDATVAAAVGAMASRMRSDGAWDERLRAAFDVLVELIVAQPAAARMCFVDVYAAGPEAVERIDGPTRAVGRMAASVLEDSPERAAMPPDIVRAVIGGLRKLIHSRLHVRRQDELPALASPLMDWALGYRRPPAPLRRPPRQPAAAPAARDMGDPRERILAAITALVAEQGYAATTVGAVAARAGVSLTTFYGRFAGKQDAFLAALDDALGRTLEVTIAAYREAEDWPSAVRAGIDALLGHLSREPAAARLAGEVVWAAGPTALVRLDENVADFQALLGEGLRRSPAAPVAAEAIGASVTALIYDELRQRGPERLYRLAPVAAFLALAPSIGTLEACTVVNEPAPARAG